jgi:uncharacterized protein (UPF0276 family)
VRQIVGQPFIEIKKELPTLGVGLGLRREIADEIFKHHQHIDWLEINPENYMGTGGSASKRLKLAKAAFPLVSHGLNLSIGSSDDLNEQYLRDLKALLDFVEAPWWSDHLSFSSIDNRYLHDLFPLPLTQEAIDHVVARVQTVQRFIGRPFLLENISYYLQVPGSQLNESAFISEIVEKADCGLLLDVNNVYVNATNLNFDPYEYVDSLPLERVVQIHVAGHTVNSGQIIDSHGEAVIEPVFELLRYVLNKTDVKGILLERDQNFPDFSEILLELKQIREITEEAKSGSAVKSTIEAQCAT